MSRLKGAVSNGAGATRYAGIYARVSTEDQGKGSSIPTQKEACQRLAAKAIAAVVIHDPDRLSRNLGHQLLLAEEFERAGVKLLIVSHPLEQRPEGWLFFQMRGALAEYERAKTAERTMRGRIGRVKAGHPHGGHAPLGYRYVSEPHAGHWEIAPEEAALVRRIFALCLSGMSTRAIARQLTRERVPTRLDRHPTNGGRKTLGPGLWAAPMVQRILTNECHVGRAYWGKRKGMSKTRRQVRPREEWMAFPVPAILDEATFHTAQQQLQRNRILSPSNRKYEYLLIGGRFCCGRCGRAMTGFPMKGVRHYRCNGRTTLMDPAQWCRGHIKAAIAEERVWATVERLLQDPDLVIAEVTRQQAGADERRAALAQELSLVETALAKCDREEQRWAEAYAGDVIHLQELKWYRGEIVRRRESLQAQQALSLAELNAIGQAVGRVEALIDYCA